MKLHSIHFANINSLAGEWAIDFDAPGLKDELFVLSGPTGAGKSSILDAITLALFGETARQTTISSGQCEVMTRGTNACFAEAEFTGMDGVRYRSRFSQNLMRHKDGSPRLEAPDITLTVVDTGVDLSHHRNGDTLKLLAEKIGFGFDDFIRTVLLEQGRFDEFLHAKEEDRASILEQATNTAKFSELGTKINERSRQEAALALQTKERVKTLRADIDSAQNPEDLEAEAIKHDQEAAAATTRAEILRREKNWLDEDAAIASEESAIGLATAALESRRDVFDATCVKIAASDKARAIRAVREADVTPKTQSVAQRQADLKKREEAAQRRADAVSPAERDAGKAKDALDGALAAVSAAGPSLARARGLDGEIALAAQALAHAESTAAPLRATLRNAVAKTKSAELNLAKANEAVATARKAIADAKAKSDALQPLRETFEKAEADRKAAGDASAETARVFSEETEHRLTGLLASLREKQRLADAVKDLAAHRKSLEPGKPCPLCGATVHPYAEGLPTPDDVQQEIAATEAELALERKKVADAATKAETARIAADKIRERLQLAEQTANKTAADAEANLRAAEARVNALTDGVPAARQDEESARTAVDEAEKQVAEARENLKAKKTARAEIPFPDADAEERRLRADADKAGHAKADADKALALARQQAGEAVQEVETARTLLKSAEGELSEARASFSNRLSQAGFSSEAELESACLTDAARAAAESCRETFRQDEASLGGRREAIAARKARHNDMPDRPAVIRDVADVDAELAAAEAEQERAVAAAATFRSQRKTHEERCERLREAECENTKQQEVARKWKLLDNILGGPGGKAFRLYAQGRNLRVLLEAASPRLEAMSGGNYRFEWDPTLGSLEPSVRDRHFERSRPVSNLSGGESFLASLALALSFSNFNTKRAPIGTLFLDEGFGTLDDISLDHALDVLSSLRASGRQVGLVTHVEQVKERIPAHIDVEKGSSGYSTLRGPGVTAIAASYSAPKKTKGEKKAES